ncbi:MAG: DinB family protein [Candidatus Zixiibacteriota bacterium]
MDNLWKKGIWGQFGAAIDTLENAMAACPDELWDDRSKFHIFWYVAYHTIFWLDYYLTDNTKDFHPPEPFGMTEMDPSGILPERTYTKSELFNYLKYCREKCQTTIMAMTDEALDSRFKFGMVDFNKVELHLYNMRHVQHGAGQLNLILRQEYDIPSPWVFTAKDN